MMKNPGKRLRLGQEIAYLLAILLMAIGVVFTEAAGFGLSMIVAPAYLISLVAGIGFGMAEYLVQGVLLIVLAAVLRRFRLSYLFSFLTAFVYGLALDGLLYLLSGLPAEGMALRILWFSLGSLIVAFSVALFFRVYLSPAAYDLTVREVSDRFSWPIGRVKLCYDLSSAAVSVVLSFIFFGFGVFCGIGVGTLILAFVNGPIIGFFGRWIDRHFDLYPMLPIHKYFRN